MSDGNNVKNILISGVRYSGKTAVCLALTTLFREEGVKTGYFKPVGWAYKFGEMDEDALLMKEVLGLRTPIETISPVVLDAYYLNKLFKGKLADAEKKIEEAYQALSKDVDVMFIEGAHSPVAFYSGNLSSFQIAKKFGAKVLIVNSFRSDLTLDDTLAQAEMFRLTGSKVIGTIFNNVPPIILEKARGIARNVSESRGIRVWGVIEEDKRLTSPTVEELCSVLEGEILEEGNMKRIVEDMLVGAMGAEVALSYFRRGVNKAVLTGGDRTDVALAALETDTSLLILTGNLYPDTRVLAKAREANVTVILVPYDTYTTIQKLEAVGGRIKPGDTNKIQLAIEKVKREVDWKNLLKAIVEEGE